MPIKYQCLRCKQYDAHSDFCSKQQQNPIYNNSSCSYYVSRTINLEKGSSSVAPIQIPTPTQPSSTSGNQIGGNSQPQNTPTGWKRFFSIEGRIGRGEYWFSFIILPLYIVLAPVVGPLLPESIGEAIYMVFGQGILVFLLSQGAKRCHDLGKSGWYQIIPFFFIWMAFAPGDDGPNEYGVRS